MIILNAYVDGWILYFDVHKKAPEKENFFSNTLLSSVSAKWQRLKLDARGETSKYLTRNLRKRFTRAAMAQLPNTIRDESIVGVERKGGCEYEVRGERCVLYVQRVNSFNKQTLKRIIPAAIVTIIQKELLPFLLSNPIHLYRRHKCMYVLIVLSMCVYADVYFYTIL